jgi:hypothetical protein
MEKRYNMLGRQPYSAPGVTSGPSTDKSQQLLQLLQTQRISSPLFVTAGTNNTFPTTIHTYYVRTFFVYYTDKGHDTNGVTASTTSVLGKSSLWHLSSLTANDTGGNAQPSERWQVYRPDKHIGPPIEQVGSNRIVEGRAAFEGSQRRQPACGGEDEG